LIPSAFIERLRSIVPPQHIDKIIASFSLTEQQSIRINSLKNVPEQTRRALESDGFSLETVPWSFDAFVLKDILPQAISRHPLACDGHIYQQNLSSMLPVILLDPKPGEYVLDACAAPGSKTTQMAALMGNVGEIIAVEAVKARFFRLKAVCALLGVTNVTAKLCDVRRFHPSNDKLFDKVLVDAPCSSEGRFRADDPKSVGYWSLRKIKEMSFKQKGILMSASRLLKPGGALVYSTCTFAPEENEEVVDWFLKKSKGEFALEPSAIDGVPSLPAITAWGRAVFIPEMDKCLRVKPSGPYSGFFLAKFTRKI
jgi:tRNA (cytosine49-C5)-methyltransferase